MVSLLPTEKRLVNVLVVDDEEGICALIEDMLTEDGYRVETANSAEDALRKASRSPFEVMIADVVMPGMNGIALLNEIKRISPQTAVVMVTGFAKLETAMQAVSGGASGFLLKPFKMQDLKQSLETALGKKRSEEEMHRLKSLASLVEMGKRVSSTLELASLAELVVEVACSETRAAYSCLMLVDRDRLITKTSVGRKPAEVEVGAQAGEGIGGRTVGAGSIVSDAYRGADGRSIPALGLPLVTDGSVLGALCLVKEGGSGPFAPSDVDFLSVLCSQAAIAIKNSQLFEELQDHFIGTTVALAVALEAKDPYTRGHSERVARYAARIAEEMGFSRQDVEKIRCAGLIHDIGKIGIPDAVLLKEGRLTDEEYREVKRHPAVGADIIRPVPALQDVVPMVSSHHERYDGRGYNLGYQGNDIPLGARILAVADSFEAMTSNRPYRTAMSREKAIEELLAGSGTQFDPEVIKAFVRVLQRDR